MPTSPDVYDLEPLLDDEELDRILGPCPRMTEADLVEFLASSQRRDDDDSE